MEKINNLGKILDPKIESNPKPSEPEVINTDSNSFQAQIIANLEKMEGLTEQIKNNINLDRKDINTAKIASDVEKARQMLDELTLTFASLKQTNDKPVVNEKEAIKNYQQATKKS